MPSASEVTLVGVPAPRRQLSVGGGPAAAEPRARRQLYLERESLIDIAERPVIVVPRPLPGDQTQIIRRPVKKTGGRRWVFVFGGAAGMAALLLALGLAALHAGKADPLAARAAGPVRPAVAPRVRVSGPIVAPLADELDPPPLLADRAPSAVKRTRLVSPALASGRHSKAAPARLASSSRLAAHRRTARVHHPASLAWVDPFIDR